MGYRPLPTASVDCRAEGRASSCVCVCRLFRSLSRRHATRKDFQSSWSLPLIHPCSSLVFITRYCPLVLVYHLASASLVSQWWSVSNSTTTTDSILEWCRWGRGCGNRSRGRSRAGDGDRHRGSYGIIAIVTQADLVYQWYTVDWCYRRRSTCPSPTSLPYTTTTSSVSIVTTTCDIPSDIDGCRTDLSKHRPMRSGGFVDGFFDAPSRRQPLCSRTSIECNPLAGLQLACAADPPCKASQAGWREGDDA